MEIETTYQKRPLGKVRKHYTYKKAKIAKDSDSNNELVIDSATRYLYDDKTYVLAGLLGILLKKRKIVIGFGTYHLLYRVENMILEDNFGLRRLTLAVKVNENDPFIPTDYVAERLESFGDLNLASWAREMKRYFLRQRQGIEQYLATIRSNDAQDLLLIQEMKEKAAKAIQHIETTNPYFKALLFCGQGRPYTISLTYSESFIERINLTMEQMAAYVQKYGIPPLYWTNKRDVSRERADKHLQYKHWSEGIHLNGPRLEWSFFSKQGTKVPIQRKTVLVPAEGGFYYIIYYVIDEVNPEILAPELEEEKKQREDNILKKDLKYLKAYKI